ncbi:MAG: BT_3987 domain-containing protein [Adhaeribacter sp.]
MYKRMRSLLLCLLALGFLSCEKYEDYIKDYEFSAVYFATQKPLRTIVAYEDNMSFKVGVALAGKRANLEPEWVTYQIDPSLLAGTGFTLLPEAYYSITNDNTGETNKMVVPKGKFIGDVTVTLNRQAFTADPLATQNTYALPLRLLETSADSILSGQFDASGNELIPAKNYTVLVVKYISPLHGTYYHKGVQKELNAQGGTVTETVFRNKDLSKNQTWDLSTLALEQVKTSGVGAFATPGLKLTRKPDNTLTLEKAAGSAVTLLEGAGKYQPEKREFYLDYKFTNAGKTYQVADTLVLRQAPEKDLRFEEW